jgi:CO/xanthine dehydrogenase Mo-binding subunit
VIGSAIEDALGVPITEMPLSPLKLYELALSQRLIER